MILLLRGLPGTGKSIIAKMIEKQIDNCLILRNDDIRENMFKRPGFSREETWLLYQEILDRMKKHLGTGGFIIHDATNYSAEFIDEVFQNFSEKTAIRILLVEISDQEQLLKRVEERFNRGESPLDINGFLFKQGEFHSLPNYLASYILRVDNKGSLPELEREVKRIVIRLKKIQQS